MSDTNVTAQELCELANQYTISADGVVESCLRGAEQAASGSGRKEATITLNSKAVSEEELVTATSTLQSKGFEVSSKRNNEWLQIIVKFDVCG